MNKDVILIGICGKMGSGKNYISEKYILPILKSHGYNPLEMSLADQIKINVMTKDDIKYEELYINKTDETRTLLQQEGTERGREQMGKDIWIKYLNNWISVYSARGITAFIIPDIRFKNEVSWIKESGGLLIKIVAPNRNEQRLAKESNSDPIKYKRIKLHPSETEIDDIENDNFDLIINNDIYDADKECDVNKEITKLIENFKLNKLNSFNNTKTIVQKYGGTSIGTPDKMKRVVNIIKEYLEKKDNLYVIVSAISLSKKGSGTTSQLLKCIESRNLEISKNILEEIEKNHIKFAEEINNKELSNWISEQCRQIYSLLEAMIIIGECSIKSRDTVISKGEIMSSKILTEYLKHNGINAVNTNENEKNIKSINETQNIVKVFGGYMLDNLTKNGVIETVGRGYSDYTAGVISEKVKADELQIWKEVDGIYSADPNTVLHAKLLKTISKAEIAQLTYYGCQAINPLTIEIVKCPIRIKNCNNINSEGTLVIDNNINNTSNTAEGPIAVTIKDNVTVINISSNKKSVSPDFFADVFTTLKKHNILVDLVSTSQVDISVAIDSNQNINKNELKNDLIKLGSVDFKENMCVLSMIGQGMKSTVGIAAKMFRILYKHRINIEMISQGSSEINISCVIKQNDSVSALCHVHYDLIVCKNKKNEFF